MTLWAEHAISREIVFCQRCVMSRFGVANKWRAATYKAPETRTKSAVRGYVYDDHPQNYFTQFGIVYAEGP